ncbi:MAG: hypothetical protein ABI678_17125 [Kofleriaceae bacterium]
MKLLTLASCSLLGLPLVACSSSGGTASDADYDDVAQNVGTSTAARNGGDVNAMVDVVLLASGDIPLGFTLGANGQANGSVLGIDFDFQVVCRNGQGTILATCNPSTQLANVKVDWGGTLDLPNFTTTMDRHGEWSLMNLQEPSVKLAGNGSFSYDSTITNAVSNATAAYHLDYDAAYMAVWIDKATRLPTAGEIQYDIAASKSVDGQQTRSFEVNADIQFNGNGTATIVLDGIHHYTLSLATGVVIKLD